MFPFRASGNDVELLAAAQRLWTQSNGQNCRLLLSLRHSDDLDYEPSRLHVKARMNVKKSKNFGTEHRLTCMEAMAVATAYFVNFEERF